MSAAWAVPAGIFGYLFIAGMVYSMTQGEFDDGDRFLMASVWPLMVAFMLVLAVAAVPVWMGGKVVSLLAARIDTVADRDADRIVAVSEAEAEVERLLAER